MIRYNDIFAWDGWGGKMKLGSGKCRLVIVDLRKMSTEVSLTHLKPYVVIVRELSSDGLQPGQVSIRSCCNHIATQVAEQFKIDPRRMLFVEYYPETTYGKKTPRHIPERWDLVDFTWHGEKAVLPRFRPLDEGLKALVSPIVKEKKS